MGNIAESCKTQTRVRKVQKEHHQSGSVLVCSLIQQMSLTSVPLIGLIKA